MNRRQRVNLEVKMNSYERIITALQVKQPDRVPILEWQISPNVIEVLEPGSTEMKFMAQELDVVSISEDIQEENCGDGAVIDEWGAKRKYLGQRYPIPFEFPIKSEQDLENYDPPDPEAPWRFNRVKQAVKNYKNRKAIIFCQETVFTYGWVLVGLEKLLISFRLNPNFARKLLRISADYHLKVAASAIELGADAIMCGDDLAYKTGLMMSKEDFQNFLLPYYQRMIDLVHSKGVPFIKHSDGNIWEILDLFVEAGIDAINPLEPVAGMDIGKVKQKYGDRICLIGNIDCGDLLCRKSSREVEKVVKEIIKKAAPGGGYILSSSNAIQAAVKPENYRTMIQATKKYGGYPLSI